RMHAKGWRLVDIAREVGCSAPMVGIMVRTGGEVFRSTPAKPLMRQLLPPLFLKETVTTPSVLSVVLSDACRRLGQADSAGSADHQLHNSEGGLR
ncbi:hypothetical protein, partial [Streptomyces sp. NPDC102437]|uniref:hypothetical protein n=1 Tax=Streptomyces sp. NPDC102437 TaxID=3366175 RepID=UPI00382CBE54